MCVPSHDLDFQLHMLCYFFVFNGFRLDVIVCFVYIWCDADHHYLNFLFIILCGPPGLTKLGEVGDFFALVSMKSLNFCQKSKF